MNIDCITVQLKSDDGQVRGTCEVSEGWDGNGNPCLEITTQQDPTGERSHKWDSVFTSRVRIYVTGEVDILDEPESDARRVKESSDLKMERNG